MDFPWLHDAARACPRATSHSRPRLAATAALKGIMAIWLASLALPSCDRFDFLNSMANRLDPPAFSSQSGDFTEPFTLAISASASAREIRYTTDVDLDDIGDWETYEGQILIYQDTRVRAVAVLSDTSISDISTVSFTYTGTEHCLYVGSAGDDEANQGQSPLEPLASISAALAKAAAAQALAAEPWEIRVQGGEYPENLEVSGDIALKGSYADDWTPGDSEEPSTVVDAGDFPGGGGAMDFGYAAKIGGNGPSLSRLCLRGPGGAYSAALWVAADCSVESCQLVGGTEANGLYSSGIYQEAGSLSLALTEAQGGDLTLVSSYSCGYCASGGSSNLDIALGQGCRFYGGTAGNSFGMYLYSGASAHINDCGMEGGDAGLVSAGAYLYECGELSLSGCYRVFGGQVENRGLTTTASYGLYFRARTAGRGALSLAGSVLAASGANHSAGLYVDSTSANLYADACRMWGGSGLRANALESDYSGGIIASGFLVVRNSVLHGGLAMADTLAQSAAFLRGNRLTRVLNCVLVGGDYPFSSGLKAEDASDCQLVNDLIIGQRYGCDFDDAKASLSRLESCYLYGLHYLKDGEDFLYPDAQELLSLDYGEDLTSRVYAWEAPQGFIPGLSIPLEGPDGLESLDYGFSDDADLRLSQGGVDLSADPSDAFTTDINGETRSQPWSIGAYR